HEGVLTALHGMTDTVGEYHPCGHRRETNLLIARRIVAKARILLHEVVDAPHRPIVRARIDDFDERIHAAHRPDETAVERIERGAVPVEPRLAAAGGVPQRRMPRHDFRKAALRAPYTFALRMHIDEEAQNSRALGGAVGARVDVHELIARARRKLAAFLL